MKQLIIVYAMVMVYTGSLFAQQATIRPLTIGDTIPDVPLKIQTAERYKKLSVHSYKGKLVLLDFWGVYCTNCINGFPKLKALQNQFKDSFAILLVTSDSEEEIQKLKRKLKQNPAYSEHLNALNELTIIHSDTLLKHYFPHEGQPTHVWLDQEQRFIKMTAGTTTTASAIRSYFKGEELNLADEYRIQGVDKTDPLSWLKLGSSVTDSIQHYSFLFRGPLGRTPTGIPFDYAPTSVSFSKDTVTGGVTGISCINNPILSLYKLAYQRAIPGFISIPLKYIIVETADSAKFYFNREGVSNNWIRQNVFAYALRVPRNQSGDLWMIMRNDLDRYFKVTSAIETRKVRCLVLSFNGEGLQSKSDQHTYNKLNPGISLVFKDVEISALKSYIKENLTENDKALPFLDETGYEGKVNLQLEVKSATTVKSVVLMQKELSRYGLSLRYEIREMPMLVIKDKR